MKLPHPIVVVPGITATCLQDQYPGSPENIWSITCRQYERITLHPDDLRYEAIEPSRVKPGEVYDLAYNELIEELRYNLSPGEDQPVPVFAFSYDWRMPLEETEKQLAAFVNEVIDRTCLLRHYHKEKYHRDPKVNLVGHSMGGLIITGYLNREGKNARVNKVATLATPFQGSFEAVIKVITGTANLGTSAPNSRERESARITPALYYLIPSFKGGISVADASLPKTLFDPGIWQPGVIASLAEFIRIRGLPSQKPEIQQAQDLFSFLLHQARAHRDKINSFELSGAHLTEKDWMAVVGVDTVTRVRLSISKKENQPVFSLSSTDRKNMWSHADTKLRRLTGDGTVPYEGAVPKFLEEKNLVLVTPDDYGYWEVQDRALSGLSGFHGILPNMNMIHRLLVRFFTGRPDKHQNTWARPAPGVDPATWRPPISLHLKETAASIPTPREPEH